jgi:hypothetical protein
MQLIYRTVFGSRLYGTELPESDHDFKGVFLPTADEILLNEVPRTHTAAAEDDSYSLKHYLELLAQGQTVALDMLFAPPDKWRQMDPLWYDILNNRDKILNKRCGAAIGYARAQAEKYSLKGKRMEALRQVCQFLEKQKLSAYLEDVLFAEGRDLLTPAVADPYIKLTSQPGADGSTIRFLEVCGKSVGLSANVKYALQIFTRVLAQYGARAAQAETGGADWKALYHAVRITDQTVELLKTGQIEFPRFNAAELLRIRKGEYAPQLVYEWIENGIATIESAQRSSELRDEADRTWIREFVLEQHREVVAAG